MAKKIAILMAVLFLCLGLENCDYLKVREDFFAFRHDVKIIFSNVAAGGRNVTLYYVLYNPTASGSGVVPGYIGMTKIGGNKARCYLRKVYVQHENDLIKHTVSVVDANVAPDLQTGEYITVQGAYDLEIERDTIGSRLNFKMSKE